MKNLFILLVLVFLSSKLIAQSKAVFIQEIKIEDTTKPIIIDIDKAYIMQIYSGDVILIKVEVELFNGGQNTLENLNLSGQYLLRIRKGEKVAKLTENSRRKYAKINGSNLVEIVKYKIYIPESKIMSDIFALN